MLDQEQHVVAALAQRRQVDGDDVEPVEEIGAEAAPPDLLLEVAIGRGDDADVHRDRLGGADRNHLPLLEHAQQLHLQRRRHLAHFVEEEACRRGPPRRVPACRGPRR